MTSKKDKPEEQMAATSEASEIQGLAGHVLPAEQLDLTVPPSELRPGDVIVLKTSASVRGSALDNARSRIKDQFPGVEVIILDEGMDLAGIIRPVDFPPR